MKKFEVCVFATMVLLIATASANYVNTPCPANATTEISSTFFVSWWSNILITSEDPYWWNLTNSSLVGRTVKIDYNGTSACRQITNFQQLGWYPAVRLDVVSNASDITYPWQAATITLYNVCGDGYCGVGESCSNCYEDCGACDSCYDYDFGINTNVSSEVIGYYNNVWYSNSDYCNSNTTVTEYYCNGNYKASTTVNCIHYCSGGRCY